MMMECLVNPLFVFVAAWAVAGTLYAAGVLAGMFPSPHALTVGAMLLNVVAFPLGYLTWTVFQRLGPPGADLPRACARPVGPKRIQRALTFTLLMGVIALVLMLYRATLIAAYLHTGLLDLMRQPALLRFGLVLFLEQAVTQTSLLIKLIALTSGLFAIGFVLLGVYLHLDGTARKYVYLSGFLLVALATSLTNLSRYDMTVYVLYLILAYGATSTLARPERRRRVAWHLLPPALTVVVIFVVVELLLRKSTAYGQTQRVRDVLFSFYWYLASPLAAFNEFLAGFAGGYGWGQNTFFPFFKWLYRFGLIAEPHLSVFTEWVFVPYGTNVYTYLRNFYADFGLFGVALIPYALGGLTAALQDRAGRYFPFLVLYVFLLVPLAFSFYNYPLLSTQFYLQILFGFLFFRYELPGPEANGILPVRRA